MASISFILGGYSVSGAVAKDVDFDALLKNYSGEFIKSDKKNRATKVTAESEASRNYIYEEPTVKNMSHLFWAVGLYKLEDEIDEDIDEFMRINECEIYKDYSTDELEWSQITEATRGFLRDNKNDFPTRFEFMLPLKLEDYNNKRQAFEIQDKYKIEGLRRFEVYATDFKMPPCTRDHRIDRGYPRVLVLEFSRPFTLMHVPMSKSTAMDYMKRKIAPINRRYKKIEKTRARILAYRDAYLVLKVKMFTYGKLLGRTRYGVNTVQMLSVLEGFEIYDSRDKERLYFTENYVTSQSKGKLNDHLKSQYELLRRKHRGEGIFH